MIRLANIKNGFFEEHTGGNYELLSHVKYPRQNRNYIGKWTTVRYKDERQHESGKYYYTDGTLEIFEFNGKYYYDDESRREVPSDVNIQKKFRAPNINNRYIIDKHFYPEAIDNSGSRKFFQILRYDIEEPFKVILRSKDNIVLVMSTTRFKEVYDWTGSDLLQGLQSSASLNNIEYISPNTTSNRTLFFNKYNNEYINPYYEQDDYLLGRLVFSEYDLDLIDPDLTFEDNTMELKTYKDKNHDRVVEKDGRMVYSDNTKEVAPSDNYPLSLERNNDFKFTPRMKSHLVRNRKKLRGQPDEILQSFTNTYNIHSHSLIDTPRRSINKGIIIRADITGADPYIVIAEYIGEREVRFICSDEARFYFNTDIEGLSVNRIRDIITEREIVR